MDTPRISASSYSNTAPLIWSFLYGANHGKVELILDNAPARSAQLLEQRRVDIALVPVISYQFIQEARLIPGVCVGAKERAKSVCLITKNRELSDIRSVALDVSSRTSIVLTKIIFREFLRFEPEWRDVEPDLDAMLADADAALLIGDPALTIANRGLRNTESNPKSKIRNLKSIDLAELWHEHTGLGFIFAMWMTTHATCEIDFAAARDEGLLHIEEIISNYHPEIALGREELKTYLLENISYAPDASMLAGMELYFNLAKKHRLIETLRPLSYI